MDRQRGDDPADSLDPEILRYIRANRQAYTREAITAELVATGHAPASVEAAWDAIAAEDSSLAAKSLRWARLNAALRSWRFWGVAILTFGVVSLGAPVLGILLLQLTVAVVPTSSLLPWWLLALFYGGPYLAVGAVGVRALILARTGRAGDTAYGILAGILVPLVMTLSTLALYLILTVIVLGICVVTGAGNP